MLKILQPWLQKYVNPKLPDAQTGIRKGRGTRDQIATDRVTGRKARGLQTEEIGCKYQTFLSLLSSRRKQSSDIFFFSIQI